MRINSKSNGFYVDIYARHAGVTGSCFLNSIHWPNGQNLRFLVDTGATQGKDNDGFYNCFFPFNTGKIDFIILTHGHHDHIGLLPVVVRQGFNGPIFTSYATANLMDIALYDSCKIRDPYSGEPICDSDEVEKALDLIIGCRTKRTMKPHKNVKIVFYANGHIVGAVVTLVIISSPGEKDITLIYTGDYKDNNIFFNVETPPKQIRELAISSIICESTYGDIDSTDAKFEKCLKDNTITALKNGMSVLYPTFAQGRHQEALFDIKIWQMKGLIPDNVDIIIDGKSSQQYNERYMYSDLGIKSSMKNFMPKNVKRVPHTKKRNIIRREILKDLNPKIILAPGGMASYGPIQIYVEDFIQRDDALIHFLGYCSPESKAAKILDTKIGDKISYNGKQLIKRCEVAKTSEKTGHAQRNKLLQFIQYFPFTKSVILNHGEPETKECFRQYLLEHLDLPEDQIVIEKPEIAFRIESDGIKDVFNTNFGSIL